MSAERGFNPEEAMKKKPPKVEGPKVEKPAKLPNGEDAPVEVTDDMIEEEMPSTKRGGELLDQQVQAEIEGAAPSVVMSPEQLRALRDETKDEDFKKADRLLAEIDSGYLDMDSSSKWLENKKEEDEKTVSSDAEITQSVADPKTINKIRALETGIERLNQSKADYEKNPKLAKHLAGIDKEIAEKQQLLAETRQAEKTARETDENSRRKGIEKGKLAAIKNREFVARDKEEKEKSAEASAQLEGEKEVAEAIAKADTLEELAAVLQGAGILKESDGKRAYEGTELAKDVAYIAEVKPAANSPFVDSLTSAQGLRNKVRELLSTSSFLEKGQKIDEAHTEGEEVQPTSAKAERKQRIAEMNAVNEAQYSAEIAEADRQLATGTLNENDRTDVLARRNEAENRLRRPDLVQAAYSTRASGDSGLSQEQSDEMRYPAEQARQDLEQASQELRPLQTELKTLKDHLEYDFKVDPEDALRDRNLQGGVKKLFGFFSARTRNLNAVLDKYHELSKQETDQLAKQLRAQQRLGEKEYPKNR